MKLNVDDLIEQGLVRKKTYTEGVYKGLSVLKYTKKVFFKNLWHLDERLLECRGTVIDEEDNVIVLPFKKVFNLGENGTTVDPERMVTCPVKVNGFMLAVTQTEKYGLIVSTTGTLDSEFAVMGRKWVETLNQEGFILNATYLFEVCDKTDPHIVDEEEGIYLIGAQWNYESILVKESMLDTHAGELRAKRPQTVNCRFSELDMNPVHEGYMIRDYFTQEVLAKHKTPFYLVKKAIMRMGVKRASLMFNNPNEFKKQIDEEYYELHKFIIAKYSMEEYIDFTQEERRTIFEGYFK
jgi:hypothetical protein